MTSAQEELAALRAEEAKATGTEGLTQDERAELEVLRAQKAAREAAQEKPFEEAPEDAFSHFLHLANGEVKRWAVPNRGGNPPSHVDGVPVVMVSNSHAPGKESGQ